MSNIKTRVNAHYREILRNKPSKNPKHSNCQLKENCPMYSACLKENIVCYATISCDDKNYKPKLYKGSCQTSLKKRSHCIKYARIRVFSDLFSPVFSHIYVVYGNHNVTITFNVPLYKHEFKLSTEYWNLKKKQINPQTSWKIRNIQVISQHRHRNKCRLCNVS